MELQAFQEKLSRLVKDLNDRAVVFKGQDPLLRVQFSLTHEREGPAEIAHISIDRNSGGSEESDYAIEDRVTIRFEPGRQPQVTCYREMMPAQLPQIQTNPGESPAYDRESLLLSRIRLFCESVLPAKPEFPEGKRIS